MTSFNSKDLDGISQTFTSSEITNDQFTYFFGLDCDSGNCSDAEKAIVILKIWNIYNGGLTRIEIEANYNLSDAEFDRLITKDFMGVQIFISDTNQYTWTWPS